MLADQHLFPRAKRRAGLWLRTWVSAVKLQDLVTVDDTSTLILTLMANQFFDIVVPSEKEARNFYSKVTKGALSRYLAGGCAECLSYRGKEVHGYSTYSKGDGTGVLSVHNVKVQQDMYVPINCNYSTRIT